MSSKCSDCDCSDPSQCTKKGYVLDIGSGDVLNFGEIENIFDNIVMEALAAENNGNCKCAPVCACIDCHCGA